MKLQLISGSAQDRKKARVKPVDHFQKCPACGSKDLIEVRPDVLCSGCDWNSTLWDVSQGAMDNLFIAAKEFGFPVMNAVQGAESARPIPMQINQPKPEVEGA